MTNYPSSDAHADHLLLQLKALSSFRPVFVSNLGWEEKTLSLCDIAGTTLLVGPLTCGAPTGFVIERATVRSTALVFEVELNDLRHGLEK